MVQQVSYMYLGKQFCLLAKYSPIHKIISIALFSIKNTSALLQWYQMQVYSSYKQKYK